MIYFHYFSDCTTYYFRLILESDNHICQNKLLLNLIEFERVQQSIDFFSLSLSSKWKYSTFFLQILLVLGYWFTDIQTLYCMAEYLGAIPMYNSYSLVYGVRCFLWHQLHCDQQLDKGAINSLMLEGTLTKLFCFAGAWSTERITLQ